MQPISGKPVGSSVPSKCAETRSTCVIWDGPDINCLGVELCKGQSIDIIIYNTAKKLCEVLEALKIDMVDLSCLIEGDTSGTPTNMQELFTLVVSKLCTLQEEVTALEGAGTTNILVQLPPCLIYTIPDPNNPGNFITISALSLIDPITSTSPIVSYLCTKICQLFSDLAALSVRVGQLELTVQTLMDTVSSGVPSANVPTCIGSSPMVLVDPQDPYTGAVPEIANLLCALLDQTGTPSQVGATNGDCTGNWPTIASAAPLGNYAPLSPATMEDLGFVANPTQLWEKINNLWVTVCDIRNFSATVKATCCPTMCEDVTFLIGAVPTDTGRGTLTFYLNGSQYDPISNQSKPADFSFAGTYGVCGVAPCWNINQPFSVIVTDTDIPSNSYTWNFTGTQLTSLYTGGTLPLDVAAQGLNPTTSYIVDFVGNIIAPDFSVCTLDQSKTLTATCISNPVSSPVISDYTYNGLTISFTTPVPSSATLTGYTFNVIDVNTPANNFSITNIPAGFSTYYLYPNAESIPGNPCSSGCAEFMVTNGIQENTTYQVTVVAVYDCGNSVPVGTTAITTYVGITLTINPYPSGSDCVNPVMSGQIYLTPDPLTAPGDIGANFTIPIVMNAGGSTEVTVYGRPGVNFGYTLSTGIIKSANWTSSNLPDASNCDIVLGVRCWGPPSLRYFYPGGYSPANPCSAGTACGYTEQPMISYSGAGCYDYLYYDITPSLTLINTFSGPTFSVNNMWDGAPGSTQSSPGVYPYTYISPDTTQFIIPGSNSDITINQNVHTINGGARPKVSIKITDPDNLFNDQLSMWVPSAVANTRILYSPNVKALPGLYNSSAVYTTDNSTSYTDAGVVGIPVFMRIEIIRFNTSGSTWSYPTIPTTSSTSCSNDVIFVTPDWRNLSGITSSTGFQLPASFNISNKDRLRITFSAGASNNSANGLYPPSTAAPGAGVDMISKVTFTQDPFGNATASNPGPYLFYRDYTNPNGNNLTDQITSANGTETNNDQCSFIPVLCQVVEFIVTDDLLIDWEISL